MFNDYILADFGITAFLITMAISMAISYGIALLLKKKPESIRTEPDAFDVPEIKEGSKFAIIFGTCWIENPVVAWWGDTLLEPQKMRIDDGGGQYMYFYKYYHGAHHIIAQGVCDGILQIKVGENLVWPDSTDKKTFNADSASSATINLPNLYGGISTYHQNVTIGGGLIGTVDFQYGQAAQTLNSYLAGVQGSYVSANRGLTAAILRQVYVGTSPNIQPWKYLVKRTVLTTSGDAQWYVAKATINTYSMNPIHILYECYTNTEWGLGISSGYFDNAIWQAAANDLYDENFGMCIKWEAEETLEDFIKEVLRYIDAVIYENHSTGEIVIKLIRDDYILGSLETFDDSDIESIEGFTRGTIHKMPDVTYVKYWNIYDNLPIVINSHDMALTNSQNEMLIPNEVSFTGVVNDTLAGQLAAREQQQLSAFAAMMSIKAKRTMAHLRPGDVFKLSWLPLGIASMVVRIATPHYGTLTDGIVTFDCIEDIFGMKDSLYAAPPYSNWDGYTETDDLVNEYTLNKNIDAYENIGVTDEVSISIPILLVNVSDNISLTEETAQSVPVLLVSVNDNIAISEECTSNVFPQFIHDIYDLQNMEDDLDGNYELVNNIDASPADPNSENFDDEEWDSAGFRPVGVFTGAFNGNGYKITGLFINRPATNEIGLFGKASNATLQNVEIENVDITGDFCTGGLVGKTFHTPITNCVVSGTITGYEDVGGIAGWQDGTFTDCGVNVIVTGEDESIGALVGYIDDGSQIRCYAQGTVNSSGTASACGGLFGLGWPTLIENCYAQVTINGADYAGGLCGYVVGGVINNCYSTGAVTGDTNLGGLVGYRSTTTVTNSFWNAQTSGQASSAGGTGKTTAEMKDDATFTDEDTVGLDTAWDFVGNPHDDVANEDIWHIGDDINENYPYLTGFGLQILRPDAIGISDEVSIYLYPLQVNENIVIDDAVSATRI